ncbi:fibronectin type III domain-containing protein [Chitinophaga niabensis]|uniref:fibronectin type III domain-containing protein n=1 Tax=Chitinophaga niabensis TaxID=536979 RepID=UPI0031BA6E63
MLKSCIILPVLLLSLVMHTNAIIRVPADWKQKGFIIQLKDDLRHPDISWPVTLLEYQLDFGTNGPADGHFSVIDERSGKQVAFQLTDRGEKNGRATLLLLSDLPSGGERRFRLSANAAEFSASVHIRQEKGNVVMSNGLLQLTIPSPGTIIPQPPVIRFGNMATGELPAAFSKAGMQVKQLEKGPLRVTYEVAYTFPGNKRYKTLIRLTAAMEFAELEEIMSGFSEKDAMAWRLVWNGLRPTVRYASTRSSGTQREPMEGYSEQLFSEKHPYQRSDQQNDSAGTLPFRLSVYDNWMSWWRLPTAAFWNEEAGSVTAGLFIKDAEKWNDGQYPIGGSKPGLSIYYHWKNNILDYSFPLVTGSRSTSLAVYPHQKDSASRFAYIEELRRYYGWISLNKTKDWILDYEAPDGVSPKYFKPELAAGKLSTGGLEQSLRNMVGSVAKGTERNGGPTPVGLRVCYESLAPSFDINGNKMDAAQYKKLRAWFLFMSYVCMDESLMPMRNMLSGHPNFLMDIKTVPALCAFLFPGHPQAKEMAAHFEKALQLNYNFHIRPAVLPWNAKAGRWTENLATYTWAALRPALRTVFLLQHYYDGKNRMLQPGVSALGDWLLHTLTPPMQFSGNRHTYPPQGAHAQDFKEGPPDLLRALAQQLVYYDPLLAEHIFWATSHTDKPFEGEKEKTAVWKELLNGEWAANKGTAPDLRSAKYTGYGMILRKADMQVWLQQIDNGPNYRWGRAAGGGNGVIYYYANGKRYSFNGPEDVGDGPFGDVERCTNFGVKKAPGYREMGNYRSIGRGDLTAPMYDFGFAQSATVTGMYHSRSILQSGADYIAVYDDVVNDSAEGRFSWFTGKEDEFPAIHQVVPGALPVDADPGLPAKGKYYDGKGDFLTIVTHLPALKVVKQSYGCTVLSGNGDTDLVFRNGSWISYQEKDIRFSGRSGIIKRSAAALFDGKEIAAGGLNIRLTTAGNTGIGFERIKDGFSGTCQSAVSQEVRFYMENAGTFTFYLDGLPVKTRRDADGSFTVHFPDGIHQWQFSASGSVPGKPVILGTVNKSGGCEAEWTKVPGASEYQLQLSKDNGSTWQSVRTVAGLRNGIKIHLRVMAKGAGGWGEPSAAYPVYITEKVPHCPEGLMVERDSTISWGQVLGAGYYRLYRRIKGDTTWQLIYSGKERSFTDKENRVCEYAVTAVNGNGESNRSISCDTDPADFLNWYPDPFGPFRRDTENHENGFPEYNPFTEDKMPVLRYPGK